LGGFGFPPPLGQTFVISARARFGLFPGLGGGLCALLFFLVEGHLFHFQARGALVISPQDGEVLVEATQVT
jgi:hypothetical protein